MKQESRLRFQPLRQEHFGWTLDEGQALSHEWALLKKWEDQNQEPTVEEEHLSGVEKSFRQGSHLAVIAARLPGLSSLRRHAVLQGHLW